MTTLEAISQVVAYCWNDEETDYLANCGDGPDGNSQEGHIFLALKKLNQDFDLGMQDTSEEVFPAPKNWPKVSNPTPEEEAEILKCLSPEAQVSFKAYLDMWKDDKW